MKGWWYEGVEYLRRRELENVAWFCRVQGWKRGERAELANQLSSSIPSVPEYIITLLLAHSALTGTVNMWLSKININFYLSSEIQLWATSISLACSNNSSKLLQTVGCVTILRQGDCKVGRNLSSFSLSILVTNELLSYSPLPLSIKD